MRAPRPPARLLLWLLVAAGCGGEDASYASEHSAEIRGDCERTIDCKISRGNAVPAKAQDKCVAIGREKLNASSDAQRRAFEDVYALCSGLSSCDYVQCTGTLPTYSELKALAIRHECTQNITCRIESGEALPEAAIDECVVHASVSLDMSDEATRTGFEARYERCAQMLSCAYTACP